MSNMEEFSKSFEELTSFKNNKFHPLVWVLGEPEIGNGVSIGGLSEINAAGASIKIGENCDIASFVSVNCSDSHLKVLGISDSVIRKDILIENNVFIGSHSVIKGGAIIRHHSVIAAGTVVNAEEIPSYSLVSGNPAVIKPGYYKKRINDNKV